MNIFVVAGHQYKGKDKGAVYAGTTEARQAVEVRDEVQKNLLDTPLNIELDDDTLNLQDTINQINKTAKKDDIAIDIHFNASPEHNADGVEAFYHSSNLEMKSLAKLIVNTISTFTGMRNRGVKPHTDIPNRNGYLKYTNCSALIIECGFLDNKTDNTIILNPILDDAIAKAISDVLIHRYAPEHAVKKAENASQELVEAIKTKSNELNQLIEKL